MVLKGLYYLDSVTLILINSSLMLEAPFPDQRELCMRELYGALRAQSMRHNNSCGCKKQDGRNGEEGKGVKNAGIY